MSRPLHKTLADYLVIAISPALIMTLVGSLVFFLVEVFYQGQYEWRLRFVLAAFVLAAVLIGRISIEFGTERATMYATPLALVTALAMRRFVVQEGGWLGSLGLVVNLGLLGLIWWAAHKLVWDCTLIDETQDSSGQGLLRVAGLDRNKESGPADGTPESPVATGELEGVTSRKAATAVRRRWWSDSRRPHAPGVWIVYFSLAALPIFGLGQAFLPVSNVEARRHAFQLLVVYAASALGLLLATSFLGLRRYLRQRKLHMPVAMAGLWIGIGAVMIGLLLGLAMLLPRPRAEYHLAELPIHFGSKDHSPSRYAIGRDGTKDQRPEAAKVTQPGQKAPKTGPAEHAGKAPTKEGQPAGKDRSAGGEKQPGAKTPQDAGKATDAGKSQHAGKSRDGQRPQDSGKSRQATSPKGDASGPKEGSQTRQSQPPSKGGKGGQSEPSPKGEQRQETGQNRAESVAKQDKASQSAKSSFHPGTLLQGVLQWLPGLLKWAFILFLAVLAGIWLFRNGASLLGEIRRLFNELRQFWDRLFGRRSTHDAIVEAEVVPEGPAAKRLADFPDPFLTGLCDRLSPETLVRYSFEALEAWAREGGHPRSPEETPLEFAQGIGRRKRSLAQDALTLAHLYCRVAYAAGTIPAGNLAALRQFWQRLGSAGSL